MCRCITQGVGPTACKRVRALIRDAGEQGTQGGFHTAKRRVVGPIPFLDHAGRTARISGVPDCGVVEGRTSLDEHFCLTPRTRG